jgi:hypothetical protein
MHRRGVCETARKSSRINDLHSADENAKARLDALCGSTCITRKKQKAFLVLKATRVLTMDLLTKKSALARCQPLKFFKMRCHCAPGCNRCKFSYNAITAEPRGNAQPVRGHRRAIRRFMASEPSRSPMTTTAHFGFKAQRVHGSLKASTFIVTRRVGVAHRAPQKRTVQIQSCQSLNDLIPRTRHAMTGIKMVPIDTASPPTVNPPNHP